jgi:hypothetical protein
MLEKVMQRPPEPRKKIKDIKASKYKYNAFKFERVLLLIYKTVDGVFGWEVESFTNNKDVWHPSVETGGECQVQCDCPNFLYKRAPQAAVREILPSVFTPEYHCKHIKMGILTLKKAGYLPSVPCPDLTAHIND